MADNTLFKHDQDFANAITLQLRLKPKVKSRRSDLIKRHGGFCLGTAEETCKNHLGFILEKVLNNLDQVGSLTMHKYESRLGLVSYSGLFLTLEVSHTFFNFRLHIFPQLIILGQIRGVLHHQR